MRNSDGSVEAHPGHQVHLNVLSKEFVRVSSHSFSGDASGAEGIVWTSRGGSGQHLSDEEEVVMPQQETIAHRILKVVRRAPGCQLDELEQILPGLTWNQIFLEIDRLSRIGQVQVMPIGNGTYTVRLSSKRKKLSS